MGVRVVNAKVRPFHQIKLQGIQLQEHPVVSRSSDFPQIINGPTSQQRPPEEIPAQLEQQIRGLAEYNDPDNQQNGTPKPKRRSRKNHSLANIPDGQQQSAFELNLPERGARPGKMLNLNCQECQVREAEVYEGLPVHGMSECWRGLRAV